MMLSKAASGCSRKQEAWVGWLYGGVVEEFNRLRKAGVKFSPKLLILFAKVFVKTSTHPVLNTTFANEAKPYKPILDRIDLRWVQRLMDKYNFVGRAHPAKLMVYEKRNVHIEGDRLPSRNRRTQASALTLNHCITHEPAHLGEFQSCKNVVESVDDTHFVVDIDNGKMLGFRSDNDVKYADDVSGGVGMTMVHDPESLLEWLGES
ncbi:hypothetical protein H310_14811 [Aphanomyces invadans]|uniref:Uncharacterized protein n=1 Tax=Aphanomyces invadans TaxID=157072 RepID=A0A024T8T0_9STRA|nr:hypothetical protein H310_14811 [Aphanomyces invadans]ETV90408.1 hypothetical protein H310_14811 [Aphanomyces invadans]|eukprot:XP_008880964.1 hypothetical protein H310_14811 [Aphanomyces invadans]